MDNHATSHHSLNLDFDIREFLLVIMRRKSIIIGATLASIICMFVFLMVQVPEYTAVNVLQVNTRDTSVVSIEEVVSGISSDVSAINSELDILRSRYLAGKVVDRLNLTKDPEFNVALQHQSILSKLKSSIKGIFKNKAQLSEEEIAHRERSQVVDSVMERLEVNSIPRSYTIHLSFQSESANKAAEVANTFVDQYLLEQLEAKFDATRKANEWLNVRLEELREKVSASEKAVQRFREMHNLVETKGSTVNAQQLAELNTQLILARTERAQAEARLSRAQELINSKDGVESAAEVLDSPLIQRLREQETEVLRKEAELSNRYGSKHPRMINVKSELRDLRKKISLEVRKIVANLENEASVAAARENALNNNLQKLKGSVNQSSRAEVQLSELVRERDANRTLFNTFLSRFKETSNQQGLEKADARVISPAEAPLYPSYPRKKVMLLIAAFFGAAIGVAVSFLLERFDVGFRSTDQFERLTSLRMLGMVPVAPKGENPTQYVVKKPTSAFSEAIRSIFTSIHFADSENPPKVIMSTSAVPQEGKTVLSTTIARVNAMAGKKVLLVDCDMRRPSVAKYLEYTEKFDKGMGDFLKGEAKLKDVLRKDESTGLDFIPATPNTPNAQGLLTSERMVDFIKLASDKYDLIVLDAPPVMAVADATVLSKVVDLVVFSVRWAQTPRDVVRTAIKHLLACNVPLAGAVLSRVELERHKSYGYGDYGYYYGQYKEYYHD